ncbi:MAG: hypothetical protein M1486_05905, partial [Gammaproteobacteria bacterium]|nr:hypothetical protein [Gammaproteobacteria bacterium]
GVIDIIRNSHVVLVPCSVDYNSIMRTVETIDEIQSINQNIYVLITKTEKEDDFNNTKATIAKHFDGIEFLELRLSKIFKNAIESGHSLAELYNENPLTKSAYKTVYGQYKTLLDLFNTDI